MPCPPGTYSGSSWTECKPCDLGNTCPGTPFKYDSSSGNQISEETQKIACPLHHYCTEGLYAPIICPVGTYNDTATSLTSVDNCGSCPPGKYCTAGMITGQCFSGYVCYNDSPVPNPGNSVSPNIGRVCTEGSEEMKR